ncbi:MAG: hypothetical protein ACRD3D_06340 [Terriglobia bacterium]
MKFSRWLFLIAVAFLAQGSAKLLAQKYTGKPFSATAVTLATGDEIPIYVDGQRIRADLRNPQLGTTYDYTLFDRRKEYLFTPSDTKKCTAQAPQEQSVEDAIGTYSWPLATFQPSATTKVTPLGTARLNGLECALEEVVSTDSSGQTKFKVWFSKDLGLPLQLQIFTPSGEVSTRPVLKNVHLGPPAPALLHVPASCGT